MFLFSSALLVSGISAQSAGLAVVGSSLSYTAPTTFIVAPSFSLGYAPSSVATGDLRQSGKLDLVTADYTSGKISVFLGAGRGSFASGVQYAVGPHPSAVVVADIDGDGRADVLVPNETEGTVTVLMGAGDGTFKSPQTYVVGFNPSFIVAGNFSGNGKTGVAVAGRSSNLLAVLLNDGNGGLKKPILYTLGKTPTALTVADFRNDGHADLALANADGTASILLSQGAGAFQPLPDVSVGSGVLSSITAQDINKDGKPDLVVTQPGQKLVSVLTGKGDGTFAPAASYTVGSQPVSTLLADVDGDGVADLVVVNNSSNTFSVLGGNGDGTFKRSADFIAGNAPLAAVAGDFYGDGHVSLAIINHSSQSLAIPVGNGDGTFKAARSYLSGVRPVSIASGNLNGDKTPGLVVANYCGSDSSCSKGGSVSVFLPDSKGIYSLSATYTVGAGSASVLLADVNGDNNLDIVALNRLDKTASVLLGAGDGTFRQPMTFALAGAPITAIAGDFSKTGKLGLAVLEDCGAATCAQAGNLEMLAGGGDGSFQSTSNHPIGYSPSSLAAGDILGNKILDIVVANRCGKDASCQSPGTASVLIGDGTGKFTAASDIALGKSPSSIALGSLSGLNSQDLVVSRSSDNTLAVLRSNGDGTFQAPVAYQVGVQPGPVAIGDFNGDGQVDVAVANFKDATVSVLYGRGDSTLLSAATMPVGAGPEGLAAIPSTTGGRASLATANGNSGSAALGTDVSVLVNIQPMAGPTPSTTGLIATPNTATVNPSSAISLTATVTGAGPTPTGTVNITGNGSPASVCSIPALSGAGTGTCTTSALQVGTTTLTASYLGDATFSTSTGTASVTITQLHPTVTVVPSPASPSPLNTSVTFTASLTGAALTPTAPTGTMTFAVGGTVVASCTGPVTSAGVATCTIQDLTAGVHSITATYSGDTNFTVTNPGSTSYTVTAAAATVGVTASPASPSAVNTSVTFTAQLAALALSPVNPSGTMTFALNGTTVASCTGTVTAAGAAVCTIQDLPAGANTITATYSGDSNFTAALAGSTTHNVSALAATVNVTSLPPSPSSVNTSVTFTAQLAGVALTPVLPTGTMTFALNGATVTSCTGTVNAAGAASCAIQNMPAGANGITASYSGDSNFTVASPGAKTQTVTALAATIGVTAVPPSPTSVNTSVTFAAQLAGVTLTPVVPSGKVNFTANGTTITGCGAVTVNAAGRATCTTSSLAAGSDPITATYSGDNNFTVAAAGTATQTVNALTPTLGLTAAPGISVSTGTSVTFTAQLAGVTLTPVTPSGTVTFTVNGNPDPACLPKTVTAGGAATCITSALLAPADLIKATYSGDTNFVVAAAATLTETVGKTAAAVTLTSSLPSASVNQTTTYTATVKPPSGTVLPSGSVTFTQGGTTLCAAVSITGATGIASCNYAFNSVSAGLTITATYSGDGNFSAGTQATASQVVIASSTTTTLNSTPNPSAVNQSVAFTAVVAPTYATNPYLSAAVPQSGSVAFVNSSTTPATTLCTKALTNGVVPVCNYTFTASGSSSVSATYTSTDSNFGGSTSSADTQAVGAGATSVVLTSAPSPSTVNMQVTFTSVVNAASGATKPQGKMVYADSSTPTPLCTVTLAADGTVPACTVPLLTAGTHAITANYTTSDSNFNSGTSNVLSQIVSQTATTTTVAPVPNPSAVDQPVTFTATVAPAISPFNGSTNPTGGVTFSYTIGTQTAVLCTSARPVSTTAGATTAVCTAPLPLQGTYSITAAYAGDTNFQGGTSAPVTQTVNAATTTISMPTAQPSPSIVNQAVSFTAVITPTFAIPAGSPLPTGTVTFTDSVTSNSCTSTVSADGTVPTCSLTLLTAGTHPITAKYTAGNTNFTSSTSAVFNQPVNPAPTSVAVVSSSPVVIATQSVTFTATVTPAPTGATVPTGTIAFASTSGLVTGCGAVQVVATGTGSAAASCPVSVPLAFGSNFTVTASYSGDGNFAASTNNVGAQQTVQNFGIGFSAPASGTVVLTQGYSNISDMFKPVTITAASSPVGLFSDPLKVTCVVTTNTSTPTPVTDPSCSPASAALPGASGSLAYTLSASATAAPGAYAVTLTAVDNNVPLLTHTSSPLVVYVVGVTPQMIVAPGIAGSGNAVFDTAPLPAPIAAPTTLKAFACGVIINATTKQAYATTQYSGLTCAGPTGGIAVTAGGSTQVPITITESTTATAMLEQPSTIYAAAFLGLPLFALIGWVGSRKSPRKNFFRFIGSILLIVGISFAATGCGGSFTRPTAPPTSGFSLGAGSYFIQVIATDQNGVSQYYAVVPLTVNN